MIEAITNLEFLNAIKKGIEQYGVYQMAVTDKENDTDPMTIGYMYTIGHQERNRPDIVTLFYCKDKDTVTVDEMMRRIRAAGALINSIVEHWDEYPLVKGHTANDTAGVVYEVHDESEFDQSFKEFTIQTSNYYGQENYPLLVLVPTGLLQ